MSGFDLKDYVDVAERVRQFHAKYPEASIQSEVIELTRDRVVVRSFVYRTPDDPRPSSGMSMMNIPGGTPYTRGSEVENAETSAVGRAIAMAGFATKGSIASADEIRNKQHTTFAPAGSPPSPAGASLSDEEALFDGTFVVTDKADGHVRQTADRGPVMKFRLEDVDPNPGFKGIFVEAVGLLAEALQVAFTMHGNPTRVSVWGRYEVREFKGKDGTAGKFGVLHASRVITADWTVPAEAPSDGGKVDDLDKLPF